jgi:hypothetical protein
MLEKAPLHVRHAQPCASAMVRQAYDEGRFGESSGRSVKEAGLAPDNLTGNPVRVTKVLIDNSGVRWK